MSATSGRPRPRSGGSRTATGHCCGRWPMSPIDYFMAIFTGMCIGLAGVAYIWS
jgi:hypothetical protein